MAKKHDKQVLIIDNATTCAMRLKTLIEIHGADAKVSHWSDVEQCAITVQDERLCLLIIEETVPAFIVEQVVATYSNVPLFLLFNGDRIVNWNVSVEVNPLSMSLSNYELMAVLEPYWAEEKSISLPDVLVLDTNSSNSHLCARLLFSTNIHCAVADEIANVQLADFDMILANISDRTGRLQQIVKAKRANPYLGVILYGDSEDFQGFEFIQKANLVGIDDVIATDKLGQELLSRFNRVWRKVAEFRDDQLVMTQNQTTMDKLLEQSLVLKVLFASSIDGIVAFNVDGVIRRVNDSFAELIGYDSELLLGNNVFPCLTKRSRLDVQEALRGDYLQQQQILELKLQHRHKVEIPVSAAINRINFHGEFVYIAVTRNVSAQYLHEKILLKKNEQLEHQVSECKKQQGVNNEIVRKGQRARSAFLAKLARLGSQKKIAPNWQKKLANIELMMQCEANQLAFKNEELDLQQVIESVGESLKALADEKEVSLQIESSDHFNIVKFSKAHLLHVLTEVLDNAIRFNLPRGEVRAYFESTEEHAIINICDTGIGVLDFKHQQILDLYQANLHDSESLYTGLPLASELMSYLGGQLTCSNYVCDSKVNGTHIRLFLPRGNE